ncbi:MAG: DUF3152 domain-containing protein [Actinomycetaceae bacterium]|nr:DUF3152 domain-containing protein [Actinomycetaceae bacterium]
MNERETGTRGTYPPRRLRRQSGAALAGRPPLPREARRRLEQAHPERVADMLAAAEQANQVSALPHETPARQAKPQPRGAHPTQGSHTATPRRRSGSRRALNARILAAAAACAILVVFIVHGILNSRSTTVPSANAPATSTTRPTQAAPTPAPMQSLAPVKLSVEGELASDVTSTSVPQQARGTFTTVAGTAPGREGGEPVSYKIDIEDGLPLLADKVAENVHAILNDPRGWGRTFNRTDGTADVRIVLASPTRVDTLCAPLSTRGHSSCRNGTNVVLNAYRWVNGAGMWTQMGLTMTDYHIYMVNHEMGHYLGHGHEQCLTPGGLAPVMKQQSNDGGNNGGCKPNGWPNPR